MTTTKNDLHEEVPMYNNPDGKTQWILAGIKLEDLVHYKEKGNIETKRLAEWELRNRYAQCVRGKDDEIKMSPHYRHSPEWRVDTDQGLRYRECVTYENPKSPNPEWYSYDDRISENYDDETKKEAVKIANDGAKPKSARWLEIYLSTLTKKKIEVNRIITGISGDGYPYNVIGQSEIKESLTDKTRVEIETLLDKTKE